MKLRVGGPVARAMSQETSVQFIRKLSWLESYNPVSLWPKQL